ncbi:MAG: hypothetical protein LBB44_02600 [Endomicrobium sp.]|jgi:hypothetical protein|nr:hypothetical protein [Endomicrobium sp.]
MREILKFMRVATVCTSLVLSCQLIVLGGVQKEEKIYNHENCTKQSENFKKICYRCEENGHEIVHCYSSNILHFVINWFKGK